MSVLAGDVTHMLAMHALAFVAIARAFESGLAEALDETPRTVYELAGRAAADPAPVIESILEVLVAAGIAERRRGGYAASPQLAFLASMPEAKTSVQGQTRSWLLLWRDFAESALGRRPLDLEWGGRDPDLLRAQGSASAMLPALVAGPLLAELRGLADRLAKPGAAFLDVGVGVGTIAIGMCQRWPELSAVGLDIAAASLALARESVARAGLTSRIELRLQSMTDLRDEDAFDLAWMTGAFIAETVIDEALRRIRPALRRDGWLLYAVAEAKGDPLAVAGLRLASALVGGTVTTASAAAEQLTAAGFAEVQPLTMPPGAPTILAARSDGIAG